MKGLAMANNTKQNILKKISFELHKVIEFAEVYKRLSQKEKNALRISKADIPDKCDLGIFNLIFSKRMAETPKRRITLNLDKGTTETSGGLGGITQEEIDREKAIKQPSYSKRVNDFKFGDLGKTLNSNLPYGIVETCKKFNNIYMETNILKDIPRYHNWLWGDLFNILIRINKEKSVVEENKNFNAKHEFYSIYLSFLENLLEHLCEKRDNPELNRFKNSIDKPQQLKSKETQEMEIDIKNKVVKINGKVFTGLTFNQIKMIEYLYKNPFTLYNNVIDGVRKDIEKNNPNEQINERANLPKYFKGNNHYVFKKLFKSDGNATWWLEYNDILLKEPE